MRTERPAAVGKVVVGVVSDTHGHLYPEVKEALQGVDHIIHAGDVGSPHVLEELRAIAPVTAVRGNCDLDSWAHALPTQAEVELGGVRVLVGHIAGRLRDLERSGDFSIVVAGHSHVAAVDQSTGALRVNPGSAGPRRFARPRTVGLVTIQARSGESQRHAGGGQAPLAQIDAEIVEVAGD